MALRLAVRSILVVSLSVVGLSVPARAQSGLGTDPRVTSGTLENGLAYVLMPIEGEGRGSSVRLVVDAGLVHESDGQFGTADVAAEAVRLGAGEGATVVIDEERTTIGFDTSDASSLASRLVSLAGAAAPSSQTLASARSAAADRLAATSALERVHDQAMRRLVPGSRLARRPAAGLPDAVRTMSSDAIGQFLGRWYVASNMTVVVVGGGSADDLRSLVQGAFGALPRVPKPASPATPIAAWAPPATPVVIEDADLTEAIVAIVSARPGRPPSSVREFRTRMVQDTATDLLEALVRVRIDKGKVPFTSADASHSYGAEGLAWSAFMVSGDPSDWRTLLTGAINEVNRVRIHGVDRADVADSLVATGTRWEAEVAAEASAPASALADMLASTRGGAPRSRELELLLAIVGSISADDVEWDFGKRFDPFASAVVLALPSRPGNPGESEVGELVQAAWNAQPEPASELVRPWKLLPTLPTPGEVVEMSQDPQTGVWSGWLSNGVRFHVRQMAGARPGGIDIGVTLAGSDLLEDSMTRGFSEALSRSWELLATPTMGTEQVFNLFQPSRTRMQAVPVPDHFRVVASTDRAWFNAYMQRLHVMLTSSVANAEVVTQAAASLGRIVEAETTDPNAAFTLLLARTQFKPEVIRVIPAGPEVREHLTPEAVTEWGRLIGRQSPIEIAIVGDIDPQDAIEAVRFYLGGLPARPRISPETFASLRTGVTNPLPHVGRAQMTTRGVESTLTLRGFYIANQRDTAEAEAFRVAANILNTRITASAPMLGLPAGGFVATNFSDAYPGTSFLYYALQTQRLDGAAVDNIQSVVEAEMARFATEGPTPDELASAVEQLAGEVEGNVDATSGWWDFLSTSTYRGRPTTDLTEATVRLRGLTTEGVRQVFSAYFSRPDNRLEISIIPPPPDPLMDFINRPPPPVVPETPEPAGPNPGGDATAPPGR